MLESGNLASGWQRVLCGFAVLLAGLASASVVVAQPVGSTSQALTSGQPTNLRPEIGALGFCTGTLVTNDLVLTAAHCIDYRNEAPAGTTFTSVSPSRPPISVPVVAGYSLGTGLGEYDLAVLRLATPMVAPDIQPARISALGSSAVSTVFGFGCQARNRATFATFADGGVAMLLVGDFDGDGDADQALTGPSSWTTMPVAASNRDGTFDVTNFSLADVPFWASQSTALTGDFDGDGAADVALVGGPGWQTSPVAFSNRDGSFRVTNQALTQPEWATWARQPGVKAVAGDFDGDGDADIALVGGAGWLTSPVAFSNRDGSFRISNLALSNPAWATWTRQQGVKVVSGDFDGDGDADLALAGGPGWLTSPVAFSNRDGTFRISNLPLADQAWAAWAAQADVKMVSGDFDSDGKADLALAGGAGWQTSPVAFSNGAGTFRISNLGLGDQAWATWARQPGVRMAAGDFDGDGDADLALAGGPGWQTMPLALSNRNGTFNISNKGASGGGSSKQFASFATGTITRQLCPGDSGGPVVDGPANGTGAILGVNSGFRIASGNDIYARASHAIPMVNALARIRRTAVTNTASADFPVWATQSRALSGDYDADGDTDIALVGGPGWQTSPVAFSNRNGSFRITNLPLTDPAWGSWTRQPGVQAVSGDFDGDGDSDIALVGGPGWGTSPVSFSNRNGSFRITNLPLTDQAWATWARQPGVKAVAGDFDGDGDADIALVGGPGWRTSPVAFSNRDGTFTISNLALTDQAWAIWTRQPGVQAVSGDFDGDGDADIALAGGAGWRTSPIAFSNRNGTFRIRNLPLLNNDWAVWAGSPGVRMASGDFDGDGRHDLVLTGGAGWRTIALAFSDGSGQFVIGNLPVDGIPAWATAPGSQVLTGVFAAPRPTGNVWDIVLVGGQGWATIPQLALDDR